MRIKILSGPAAGQLRYAEKSQATQLLIDTGLAELYIEPPPEPAKVTWGISKGQVTERIYISGTCSRSNCGRLRYDGPAASTASIKFQHCCGADAIPTPIPSEIVERYARAKGEEIAVITKDEGVFWNIFHNKAGDNTHREVNHGKPLNRGPLAYEEQ